MGYVMRVRLASFFTGAALASGVALRFLQKDYEVTHRAISEEMNGFYESLDGRVSALEKLKEAEAPKHVGAAE